MDHEDGPIWPGPAPEHFVDELAGCGTLSGTDARRVYAAARANPNQIWIIDGRPQVLAVAAVLPGTEAC